MNVKNPITMKKTILKALVCASALLTFNFSLLTEAHAQDSVFSYTHQGTTLYYIVDSTGDATVVAPWYPTVHWNADSTESDAWWGYARPQGAVTVPDSVPFLGTNHAVIHIGRNAFYKCDSVTAITLPGAVNSFDKHCFRQCYRLTSINIPQGVSVIPYACFYQDSSLANINLPEGLTAIEYAAFALSGLQSVSIPSGVSTIGQYAFFRCYSLTSVTIPRASPKSLLTASITTPCSPWSTSPQA